ncbi:MAG: transglutaminase family protein [Betaproteobacteria bacterium]
MRSESLPALYHVVHETRYDYENPVSLSHQHLHLSPRDCLWQTCIAHQLSIDPLPTFQRRRFDSFGNPVTELSIEAAHNQLFVRSESTIEVRPHLPLTPGTKAAPARLAESLPWESVRDRLSYGAMPVLLDASRFLFESPYVRVKHEFSAFARSCFEPKRPLLDAVQALMTRIYSEFKFDAKATTVATPVLQILEEKRGVCQDFAHLMLACLRSLGLSARYVSGYLLTQPPPGQERMIGADASHAWISVFCPELNGGIWVDFDPTNNILPDTQHITLAWGRDFGDISPLRGVILGGEEHDLDIAVTVTPCDPDNKRMLQPA